MTDDRAEGAFRTALARAADDYDVVPLAPLTPRPRRTWPALVAAAAVLVLVGSVAFVATRGGSDRPDGAADPGPVDGLPEGWHWESFRDAVVGVPDTWGYAYAADDQWCADVRRGPVPDRPFVDLHGPHMAMTEVLCPEQPAGNFTGIPERLLRTHLSFEWYDETPAGTRTWNGWTEITRHVGSAVVQVLADEQHLEIAEQVIATARQSEVDGNGCPARSPIQRGGFARPEQRFDVAAIESVEEMVVCQYSLVEPAAAEEVDGPGLVASRRVPDSQTTALLDAIKAAPVGGGPDRPSTCAHEYTGSSALVVRITAAGETHELYVYTDSCTGNGLDDGTALRSLTPASCAPLFGDRVFFSGGIPRVADYCF